MLNWVKGLKHNQPPKKTKVLFLASNPANTNTIQLDEESRLITQKIRASELRDSIEFISAWAVRTDDLLQLLNEHNPDVLHFSGHGNSNGELILVDSSGDAKPVNADALRSLLKILKGNIKLVIFNSCFSSVQAKAVYDLVDCVIGMSKPISDDAAIVFSGSFYRAIGFGLSIKEAYEQGIVAIELEGMQENDTPQLYCAPNTDSLEKVLVSKGDAELTAGDLWSTNIISWVRCMYFGDNGTTNFNELELSLHSFDDSDLYSKGRNLLVARDYVEAIAYWNELYSRHSQNIEYRAYLYLSLSKVERWIKIKDALDMLISQAQSAETIERYDEALDRLQLACTLSRSNPIFLRVSNSLEERIEYIKDKKGQMLAHEQAYYTNCAKEYLERQNYVSAILILLEAQRKFPDSIVFSKMLEEARGKIV
jgi:hypothetical protein